MTSHYLITITTVIGNMSKALTIDSNSALQKVDSFLKLLNKLNKSEGAGLNKLSLGALFVNVLNPISP